MHGSAWLLPGDDTAAVRNAWATGAGAMSDLAHTFFNVFMLEFSTGARQCVAASPLEREVLSAAGRGTRALRGHPQLRFCDIPPCMLVCLLSFFNNAMQQSHV